MIIYTNKKDGKVYNHIETLEDGKFMLSNDEETRKVSESTLKRWYKQEIVVDFEKVEEPADEPETEEPIQETEPVTKKAKKASKPRATSYEEQHWGLPHHRMTAEDFEGEWGLSLTLCEDDIIMIGGYRRTAFWNPITGCVWFRFKNEEYEISDMDDPEKVEISDEEEAE